MKKIGLVGGTGPESTIMYYKELNSRIDKITDMQAHIARGKHIPGPLAPQSILIKNIVDAERVLCFIKPWKKN